MLIVKSALAAILFPLSCSGVCFTWHKTVIDHVNIVLAYSMKVLLLLAAYVIPVAFIANTQIRANLPASFRFRIDAGMLRYVYRDGMSGLRFTKEKSAGFLKYRQISKSRDWSLELSMSNFRYIQYILLHVLISRPRDLISIGTASSPFLSETHPWRL